MKKSFAAKRTDPTLKKPMLKDICEEGMCFVQSSFEGFFQSQLDLKDFVAKILGRTGTSWTNKLTAQALFPGECPIIVDMHEGDIRDAFVTNSMSRYAETLDSELEQSIGRAAGSH